MIRLRPPSRRTRPRSAQRPISCRSECGRKAAVRQASALADEINSLPPQGACAALRTKYGVCWNVQVRDLRGRSGSVTEVLKQIADIRARVAGRSWRSKCGASGRVFVCATRSLLIEHVIGRGEGRAAEDPLKEFQQRGVFI